MRTKNFFLTLLLTAIMCVLFTANAQVTIGSTELPEAMLDIRAYPQMTERGQGFRLIDGNQADGRVLTVVGNDGVATWMPPAGGVRRLFNLPNVPHFNLLAPMNILTPTNVVIIDHEAYTFVLEPGFWRIDFTFGIAIENFAALMPSFDSFVELLVTITPLSSSDAGADDWNNVRNSMPNREITFIRKSPATADVLDNGLGQSRAVGSLMVDTRELPTQKYRIAIGRSIVRNVTADLNIRLFPPNMHRTGFATFVPELP